MPILGEILPEAQEARKAVKKLPSPPLGLVALFGRVARRPRLRGSIGNVDATGQTLEAAARRSAWPLAVEIFQSA